MRKYLIVALAAMLSASPASVALAQTLRPTSTRRQSRRPRRAPRRSRRTRSSRCPSRTTRPTRRSTRSPITLGEHAQAQRQGLQVLHRRHAQHAGRDGLPDGLEGRRRHRARVVGPRPRAAGLHGRRLRRRQEHHHLLHPAGRAAPSARPSTARSRRPAASTARRSSSRSTGPAAARHRTCSRRWSTSRPRSKAKKGKHYLVSSIGCKSKKHDVRREVRLRPERDAPGRRLDRGHQATAKCKK